MFAAKGGGGGAAARHRFSARSFFLINGCRPAPLLMSSRGHKLASPVISEFIRAAVAAASTQPDIHLVGGDDAVAEQR